MSLIGHNNTISALVFAPIASKKYGGCLASGSIDGTIRFWNPIDGKEIQTFASGHIESIKALAFSDTDMTISTGAINGTVDVWSLQTHDIINTFTKGQCDAVNHIAFSPTGKHYVRQGWQGLLWYDSIGFIYQGEFSWNTKVQSWHIASGKEIQNNWVDDLSGFDYLIFSLLSTIL